MASITKVIPYQIKIDSTRTMKTFYKNRPKVMQLLEIDCFQPLEENPHQINKIKQRIIKMAKHSKTIKGLRLHKCLISSQRKIDNQLKYLMKKFQSIESISLSINGPWDDLLLNYARWIFYPKRLSKLYFILRKFVESPLAPKINRYIQKFLKVMQKKKLQVIKILLQSRYEPSLEKFLLFKNYPKTIEKFSFSWHGCGSETLKNDFDKNNTFTLQNFGNLQTFNIAAPLSKEKVSQILHSNSSPDHLDHLEFGFNLQENHAPPLIYQYLKQFPNLTTISLKTDYPPTQWGLFTNSLALMPLKNLKLDTLIHEVEDLKYLGDMIQNSVGLSGLILKLKKDQAIDFSLNNCFEDFFENISKLENLNKLKIYFTLLSQGRGVGGAMKKASTNNNGFVSNLSSCLNKLESIRELSIRFRQGNYVEELPELIQSLKPKSGQMKKLRIGFGGEKISPQNMMDFFLLLSEMRNLESLVLNEVYLEKSSLFETYTSLLLEIPQLRKIQMNKISGFLNLLQLKNFVSTLLQKKGFRKIYCTKNLQASKITGTLGESDKIDLATILGKNPQLEQLYVPFDIFTSNIDDLSACKWNL